MFVDVVVSYLIRPSVESWCATQPSDQSGACSPHSSIDLVRCSSYESFTARVIKQIDVGQVFRCC
jgi:hypothetical protein